MKWGTAFLIIWNCHPNTDMTDVLVFRKLSPNHLYGVYIHIQELLLKSSSIESSCGGGQTSSTQIMYLSPWKITCCEDHFLDGISGKNESKYWCFCSSNNFNDLVNVYITIVKFIKKITLALISKKVPDYYIFIFGIACQRYCCGRAGQIESCKFHNYALQLTD